MPFYSDELVEEVRSRSDIVAVIGARVRLTKKGANYFGCCPFHSEKTPSFSVSQSKQMYYCFGCGAGGNVVTFLMNYENLTFPEAMEQLASRAGITLPKRELTEEEKKQNDLRTKLLEINTEAAKFYYYALKQPVGEKGMEYLTRRGLSADTIRRFGLGYSLPQRSGLYQYLKKKGYRDQDLIACGLIRHSEERGAYDYFFDRVMYPIMDKNSRVIAFGGRVLGKGEPKYLNSPETPLFDKSRNLYGLHLAKSTRRPYFLLCEGYMDVIALHQAGFDCAVASLGTSLTGGHAMLLKRHTSEVILTYDSDGAGVKAAMRAIPILRNEGLSVKVLNMRPYKDPDEFIVHEGAEAYEQRIAEAENFFLYESDVWRSQYDMTDPAGRTAFQKKLAEELTVFEESLERENYLNAVCERHMIQPELLRGLVNRLGNSRVVRETVSEEDIPSEESLKQNARKDKDEGLLSAAQVLLCWMAGPRVSAARIAELLQEEEIPQEVYRKVYRLILEEKTAGRETLPASILNHFLENEEDSKLTAAIFSKGLSEEMLPADRSRVLTENLRRLKKAGLKDALRSETDPRKIQELAVRIQNVSRLSIREEES